MAEEKIKYYFWVDWAAKKPLTVHRRWDTPTELYMERWDGHKWVDNPRLISASGIGGDNPYDETTEEKALEFIKNYKPPK